MFSSTAYEAFYTYIGLHLHEASIKIITSYKFLVAIMLMTFALTLFSTCWKYFSRYFPPGFGGGGGASLGRIVKTIACLFVGMMVLRVNTQSSVSNFKNQSWHENSYIKGRSNPTPTYQVSFLFDILSRSAEEIAAFATEVVDGLFMATNSQLESPDYFYKAVMYAGVTSIDDPQLRGKVSYYTEECFDLIIPDIDHDRTRGTLSKLFNPSSIAPLLDRKTLSSVGGNRFTCLDLSEEVNRDLVNFAKEKFRYLPIDHVSKWGSNFNLFQRRDEYMNLMVSSALVDHYASRHEGLLGIHKGSQLPGGATSIVFQFLNKLRSWDGFLSIVGQSDKHGAATAAEKSQEFSELLQRAPHIKGFTKLALIAIFPWLVFFIIAGRWKVIVFWAALYCSVLLWEPLWTLCYHLITHIALSTEAIASFDDLAEGFSLYSAELINSRMYYAYSIYSWVQILVGPLPTLILAINMRSLLSDTQEENAPTIAHDVTNYAIPSGGQMAGASSKGITTKS